MTDVIDTLQREHRNIRRLLELLQQQTDVLGAGERPDFDLLIDLLDYIANYPGVIHHPKEDAVFRVYLERSDQGADTIRALLREHDTLRDVTKELRDALSGVDQDVFVPRERLEQQCRAYVDLQRRHMAVEESAVFPLVRRALKPADWKRIEADIPLKADPLFGEEVQEEYRALYDRITRETTPPDSEAAG